MTNQEIAEVFSTSSTIESSTTASSSLISEAADESIVEKVSDYLKRFIFLKNPAHYTLLALWVIETHLIDCFEYTGYVFVYSAGKQSGKTRVLEVLDLLVYSSSGVQYSPTEAVLFRTAKGHTQLFDEVDSWNNKENLLAVLNAGFRKGGTVYRLNKKEIGGYHPEAFSVFAPRSLAGIGVHILNDTTLDRCFKIRMERQTAEERREKLTRKKQKEAAAIKKDIETWAKENKGRVLEEYEADDFPYLDNFQDRTIDISQPLAAIVEVMFMDSPKLTQIRGELVNGISSTRHENEEQSREQSILLRLAELSMSEDPLIANASELAEKCKSFPERPKKYEISSLLKKHGFKPKSIRKNGEDPKYRYFLPMDKLVDLVTRYVLLGLVTTGNQESTTEENK